jgi:hypothetical protein
VLRARQRNYSNFICILDLLCQLATNLFCASLNVRISKFWSRRCAKIIA